MGAVLEFIRDEDVVVAGIGHTARELYALRMKTKAVVSDLLRDFLCVGGMGLAFQVAMGAALSPNKRRVWCFEGDGSFLMHLGSVALAGTFQDLDITYVLLDNRAHASVGGQSVAAGAIDYAVLSRVLGFRAAERADSPEQVREALPRLLAERGPRFLWAPIRNEPDLKLPRPAEGFEERKEDFMRRLMR